MQVEYIPGTQGAYFAHGGWGFNGTNYFLKTCDDGDKWEVITANRNVTTLEFLSRNVGYAGDNFSNATQDGMFKWDSDLLMDCEEVISKVVERTVSPIELFPKPATDFLSIRLPEPANMPSDSYLFDDRGRLLGKQQLARGAYQYLASFQGHVHSLAESGLVPVLAGDKLPTIPIHHLGGPSSECNYIFEEDPEKPWLWVFARPMFTDTNKVLFAINGKGEVVEKYPVPPFEGAVTNMVFDKNKDLWISTYQSGILKFDRKKSLLNRQPFPQKLLDKRDPINTVLVDRKIHLWARSNATGAWRFDLNSGEIENLRHEVEASKWKVSWGRAPASASCCP